MRLEADLSTNGQVYRRSDCRLCGDPDLDLVLQLEPSPPVDAFVPEDRLDDEQARFPLDLFLCRSCGHAQLLDVVDQSLLFGDYIYETKSSPGLVDHFRRYAEEVKPWVIAKDGLAVDIGSNDGTLLGFLKERGMRVLGVDPATNIAQAATAAGIETVPAFFTNDVAKRLREEHGPAALITANNVYAHADDMGDMTDGIATLLADDGIFVSEVSYLLDMIDGMVFDFIYHEHLCHHAVAPLDRFLRLHGLELVDIERIPTKGGSLRVKAQLEGGPREVEPSVAELLSLEEELGLQQPEIFEKWVARIDENKARVEELVEGWRADGKKIAAYGASATGTVLLYHYGLTDIVEFIVDDNPERQGLYSPGKHIPVISSEEMYERKPDVVIVLAWRFADPITEQHGRFVEEGGQFLVPLPEVKVG